jgi:phosphoribosylaminoimidazole carboxylase (NCAIR synthetase)
MFNILGSMPNLASLSMETNIFIHDYKKSPRENRKIGHINGVSLNNDQIQAIKQLLFL